MTWQPVRNSNQTLQNQIITWMTDRIESGDWSIGTKLPTQRELAMQFNVNRSTVQNALEELKADGLLEAKIGSGVFVANNSWQVLLKRVQPNWQQYIDESIHKPNFHTIQLINEYEQSEDIIRLGTGELAPSLLPTERLEESLKEISLDAKEIGYSSPQGSKKLRIALCKYLQKRGIQADPSNILIVSGALQGLQLLANGILGQGSILFQDQSSYLNSVHPFQSVGVRLISVTRDENLATSLLQAKRKRHAVFYCVPTLNNPTGTVWTKDEMMDLYNICQELQMPIIEDDVYHDLLFDESLTTIKSLDTAGQVLHIGSVSKTLSPGLRIGWIVGPTTVINRLADIKMQTDYGSSAISQQIVEHWLSTGLYENHLITLRNKLKARAEFIDEILKKQFRQIASWESSKGGFFIWLRFNDPIVNKNFFLMLLHQKVLINPGYIYDSTDTHHIRLSYAYASLEELKIGMNLLLETAQQCIQSSQIT